MSSPDWNCPHCGHLVFGSKMQCYKCGTTKTGQRQFYDDWWCNFCKWKVFGSKPKCLECGTHRPASAARSPPPAPTPPAPGQRPDWTCPGCSALVFGSKTHCFKCTTPNPALAHPPPPSAVPPAVAPPAVATATPAGRRPDWTCPGCAATVFGSKDKCFKCGTSHPSGVAAPAAPNAPAAVGPGANDWICPQCAATVFGSKAACFKCNTPRPATAKPASAAVTGVKTKFADWNCPCGKLVFGSRAGCFACGRPNPSLATSQAATASAADPTDPAALQRLQDEIKAQEAALLLRGESAKSNLRRAMAPPPPYWDLSVSGTTVFPAPGAFRILLDVEPETAALQELMLATVAGRAPSSTPPTIVRAWRVQNDNLWLKYCMNRDLMADAMAEADTRQPGLFTLVDAQEATSGRPVAQKRFLSDACNEKYLWHATGAAAVSIICEEGFDERVCALSGLFGAGVYFAELASKSFGYMPSGPCLDGAHKQTVGYMFLARVCVGTYHKAENTTMSNIRRAPNGCDSVVGVPSAGAPREFIVYDRRQTYPEFLLEIKR